MSHLENQKFHELVQEQKEEHEFQDKLHNLKGTLYISKWDAMTDRQKMIRISIYSYHMILCGVNPHHYLNLEEI